MKIERIGIIVTLVLMLVSGAVLAGDGCGSKACAAAPALQETPKVLDHKEAGGPGGAKVAESLADEANADLGMTPAEIMAKRCEHEMAMMVCAECRYEVGVVALDPSLTKPGPDGKPLVVLVAAAEGPAVKELDLTGEIQLDENTMAHVTSRIAGHLLEIRADLGTVVKKGDVLAVMESPEVGQLFADLDKARMEAALGQRNFEREKKLCAQSLATQAELAGAELAYEQASLAVQALEKRLQLLGLEVRQPDAVVAADGLKAGQIPIVSSVDGVVIERRAVRGATVVPEDVLFQVASLNTVWAWAGVRARDLATVLAALKAGPVLAEVVSDAYPGTVFKGHLDYVGATMDETTRQVRVRIVLNNPEAQLRAGLFCSVRLRLADSKAAAVWVPRSAVMRDEAFEFVYKPLKEGYVFRRQVKTGLCADDRIQIVAGVAAGETVVSEGTFMLKSDTLRSKMGAGCAE